MQKRILILCTGNSCRSQMAQAFLASFDPNLMVYSAGTAPSSQVHPKAIQVMAELHLDLSHHQPKLVDIYLEQTLDYVITVCDHAKEACPVFLGNVGRQIHIGFEDPAEARGSEDEILAVFRRVRDQIRGEFLAFYQQILKDEEAVS